MSRASRERALVSVQETITDRTGMSFAGSRGDHLASIVESLMAGTPGMKADILAGVSDEAAFARFCDALTVQESFFFREPSRLALSTGALLLRRTCSQPRRRRWRWLTPVRP